MSRFDFLEFEHQGPDEELSPLKSHAEQERDEHHWLRQADDHRRKGHYENALRYYSRALERDKALIVGWLGQVQMLVMLGEEPEAELWARKALELFRGQGDLMAGRAQALARMGDRSQAGELSDAALKQEGHSAYRWVVRGELMIKGGGEVDRHCFDKAVIAAEGDWLVPLEVAMVYLHYRVPSKALMRARQAVERAPDSPYAWYVQGRCETELGLDRSAGQSLGRCLELTPGHIEASRLLEQIDNRGWSLGRGLRRLFGRD